MTAFEAERKRRSKTASDQVLVFLDTGFDFVIGRKLISDHSPILDLAAIPFFAELGNSQIEQFQQGVFVWKRSFFGDFSETEWILSTAFVVYIIFLNARP